MNDIFISYRRQDSAGWAARLRTDLALRYGKDRVFLDFADLAPGLDFVSKLHQVVGACKSVLVVIGPQWTTARDQNGLRRLDNPDDFIRTEIAAALRAEKVVVPVLVGGATLPSADELPRDIRDIRLRHAGVLGDVSWDVDLRELYGLLDPLLGVAPRPHELAPIAPPVDVLNGRRDRLPEESPTVRRLPSHKETAAASADVFVSYADEDRPLADQVVQVLEGRGHPCWIAHRNIPAGVPSWTATIVGAIANCRVFIVLVTGHSISSKQVLREVTVADDENIAIIPFRFDNAPLSKEFRYFFASTQRLEVANMPWEQAAHLMGIALERQLSGK